MSKASPPPEQAIVRRIGLLLRTGVLAATILLLGGGAIYLYRHGTEAVPDRTKFEANPPEFTHFEDMVQGVLAWRGRAIIQLGLLVLIATPVMRVGYALLAFARERDKLYVLFALTVLAVLAIGFFFAPGRR